MTLVPSLLQALVLMDGEALVLHVGDKPYVVAESGQVSLANAPLTADAIGDVIEELLPAESKRRLDDVGATQCALPENHLFPGERFSVVAARGGDDLWLEVRRAQESPLRDQHAGAATATPASQAAPVARERRKGQRTANQAPSGRVVEPAPPEQPEAPAGNVLPLTRALVRADVPPPLAETALSGLDRLLRLASARGASTLYLVSGARPSIRIDGDVKTLDGAAVLEANDVEALLLTLMPERSAEALRSGAASEWISEFSDLGRVRCLSFRDYRGPGGVFRIMPQRAVTTEQLGLSREIQALADEAEGLLVVTGPRLSGKRTLMSAFVDHINRTRHLHIITIERDINIVHERVGIHGEPA